MILTTLCTLAVGIWIYQMGKDEGRKEKESENQSQKRKPKKND